VTRKAFPSKVDGLIQTLVAAAEVGDEDAAWSYLRLARDEIATVEAALVADMRAAGCTWEEIGQAAGVSRQYAHRKWSTETS